MSSDDPYGRDRPPRPIGTSLEAVSRRLGVEGGAQVGALFATWGDLVGEQMAEHVRPVKADRDALVVEVDHPAWATQVRHLGEGLLDRVAEGTGLPRPARLDVRVRR